MTRRVVMISPGWTALDQFRDVPDVRLTPSDTWAAGLGALLTRVGKAMDGAGVVLFDAAAARALKLPTGPADRTSGGVDDASAAGWLSGTVGPWTVFYGERRPSITVGLTSWPDFTDRCPLVGKSHMDTVSRLSLWHELTGEPWCGTPGVAGLNLMRATMPSYPANARRLKPTYKLHDPGPEDAYELDYRPSQFARPQTTSWAHGYDARRMYLAAAGVCEQLSPWKLHHTSGARFDPKRAGWWLVELGKWNDDRIPAPAGYGDKSRRWVTTPTLTLLDQLLSAGGAHQPYELIDSWTAPGKRILQKWSATLEGAYQAAVRRAAATEPAGDPLGLRDDAEAVRGAVKLAYSQAWGMLSPHEGPDHTSIHRPDWHFAIMAQARANLWRKMWEIGTTENRWPLEVNVDCVWYGSDIADPHTAIPRGIRLKNPAGLSDALGTFKVEKSRERGKA